MVNSSIDLSEQISEARQDFKGKTTVAFIGDSYCGKTILCALLKDTASKYLPKETNEKYYGFATNGRQRINEFIYEMYHQKFPDKTTLSVETDATIKITSDSQNDIELVFHDMPGEKYKEYLENETKLEELDSVVKTIMDHGRDPNKKYGKMAHIIFAQIYVILIDCSIYKSWRGLEGKFVSTLQNLLEYKKYIGKDVDGKIYSPVSIVFTKYDTLDPSDQKPPNELLDELNELKSAFNRFVKHDPKCFISKITANHLTDKQTNKIIDQYLNTNDEEYVRNTKIIDERNEELQSIKQSITAEEEKFDNAKTKYSNFKNDPNIINNPDKSQLSISKNNVNTIEKTLKKLRIKYDEIYNLVQQAREKLHSIKLKREGESRPTLKQIGKPDYCPTDPLEYSHAEYINLIKWFIKMHNNHGKN